MVDKTFVRSLTLFCLLSVLLASTNAPLPLSGSLGQVRLTPVQKSNFSELFLKINPFDTSPYAVNSLAFAWNPDAEAELSVELSIIVPLSELYFTGKILLFLDRGNLTFQIGNDLIKALDLVCNSTEDGSEDFVYSIKVSPSTHMIIWRIVAWNVETLTDTPVISLNVDKNGTIFNSFPGLLQACSKAEQQKEFMFSMRGNVRLRALAPSVDIVAHADSYDKTAQYYLPTAIWSSGHCSENCSPVLLPLPAPSKGHEYGCRLKDSDRLEEWWQCDRLGYQNIGDEIAVGTSMRGGAVYSRLRLAASLQVSEPTDCVDIRKMDETGQWQRYDNVSKTHKLLTNVDWHSTEATGRAYRCISPVDGTVIKDVFLENGDDLVSKCLMTVTQWTPDATRAELVEAVELKDDKSSEIRLECALIVRPIGCDHAASTKTCDSKTTFTFEPSHQTADWQRFLLSPTYVEMVEKEAELSNRSSIMLSVLFNISSKDKFQAIEPFDLSGTYNVFLHFPNNISYLAGQFEIKRNAEVEEQTTPSIGLTVEDLLFSSRISSTTTTTMPQGSGADAEQSTKISTFKVGSASTTVQLPVSKSTYKVTDDEMSTKPSQPLLGSTSKILLLTPAVSYRNVDAQKPDELIGPAKLSPSLPKSAKNNGHSQLTTGSNQLVTTIILNMVLSTCYNWFEKNRV